MTDAIIWLIPSKTQPSVLDAAVTLLRPHTEARVGAESAVVDVSVGSTRSFGGRYSGSKRPLALSTTPLLSSTLLASAIQHAVGTLPPLFLELRATCHAPEDHQVLADTAAFLASTYRLRSCSRAQRLFPTSSRRATSAISLPPHPFFHISLTY